MSKIEIAKKGALKPAPRVIVSVRDKEGRNNALAVGYCGNCSYDPPMVMVGVVPSRFSYKMFKETDSFVVNVPVMENKELFDYMGSVSGRDEDKFANVNWNDGDVVNAPILDDCPINIECTIVDSIMTGSHEMFVGKVEKVHADESCLNDDNQIDDTKLQLIP